MSVPANISDMHPADAEGDVEQIVAPSSTQKKAHDPNIVDFDGPDDPENPLNWSFARKTSLILIISLITFVSPIGSTITSTGASNVLEDFHSDNEVLAAMITTVYLLGYASGPLVIAPLSELYGRDILYKTCNVFFLIFNIACAVANSLESLIVFRLLAGIFSSCPITLGASSIADMIAPEERGLAMAAWVIGPMLGPAIGPVCGGYLTPIAGWRWSFWVLSIASGLVTVLSFLFLRETYAYIILQRKTISLRKQTGNPDLQSALDLGKTPRELFAFSILRPLKMLVSPIIFLLSLYVAVVYAYEYLCLTTFPRIFEVQYGFSSGAAGLVSIGLGIGAVVGLVICGSISDRLSAFLARRSDGDLQPEYRLPTMAIGAFFVPIGLFMYGWTAEEQTHWIAPIIGTAFLSGGLVIAYMAISTYLVDAYTVYSASAIAASTIFRCLLGALLPLAGNDMYDALGVGWGTSLLGFISLAFLPLPFVFYLYGKRIRETQWFKVEL